MKKIELSYSKHTCALPSAHQNLKSAPNSDFKSARHCLPPQLSFCFWLSTDDGDNYGTPLSYATTAEDNELTLTDYREVKLDLTPKMEVQYVICSFRDVVLI